MAQLELKHFQAFERFEVWAFLRNEFQRQIDARHQELEEQLDVVKIMRTQGEIKNLKSMLALDAGLMYEIYQANEKENEDDSRETED